MIKVGLNEDVTTLLKIFHIKFSNILIPNIYLIKILMKLNVYLTQIL